MKHYTHFLPKKTLKTVKTGKQANALNYEIEETQRKLNRLIRDRDELESEIYKESEFYHGFSAPEFIKTAKAKADHYNNVKITSQNPNQTKTAK
ncbi:MULTISPECIES: aspartyl-phosphate phosphatase Spo0E family protein [unclassified Chryseobacterium]|uniref:aspartyl-phosphate phosphatase Spo0E family protein n=1 Tax=unclassified Chryseobacterium TaxID=2593645 RepID=UPI000D3AD096|nr:MULTISPECIES: aspartyl-phosphate phosphatase Spo0E family protein [unclassified Chryseobacterium]PTT77196.1 hypothetical protein DBR25_03830 [Chryseobacterium sp. HMWF001]PVV54803.1 hypothetical protein DD829_16415 [Chryseobacterium sp. HMWF035]